ncbi:exopolysaccharide biosynthesis polyprenyl glycosylphosphotransferase [Bradyrhizobium huanghuaihaiense]|uniref:exopolysaccharide biosynthesis polyprenyl glycosylphosphotransferase n=1 Tax=Bradyrhizobium huanghuaihaiense TaxID=990078 RepID=UPI0021AA8195|nr:exopolysaccharide biosynthesis polyprenyl glycosylphosphotransferase [Bradyrhizobium sp. CB3035]UWU74816.1 exopolysaccharide biosynthesis polyprenyl glycosylphosphotransferase [Bradyrhizobium sp. CB3035]
MPELGVHRSRAPLSVPFVDDSAADDRAVDIVYRAGAIEAVAEDLGLVSIVELRSARSDATLRSESRVRQDRTSRASPSAARAGWSDPNCRTKRIFDVVVTLIAIIALIAVFVVVAMAVTLDRPGPVFFRQWRGGRDGQRFQIWKFRTMTCLEDGNDVRQASPNDARVTRVGRVLRKTSIDELPQLLNVLRGDMSLVGPRPHALAHDAIYSRLITEYAERQSVKPGITGWAQVNGCRGETRDIAAMERRVKRDLQYVRHWSLRFDIVIMLKTVRVLLRPSNAY